MTPIDSRAWGLLLALASVWGASFLSIRIALDQIGPLWVVAHRTGWAVLALGAWLIATRMPFPRGPAWPALAVMGLLNNMIPFGLMAWGQQHIPTGLTSIFNAATAVFGALVAGLLLSDERLDRRRAIGIALGFAGVVVAIGADALAQFDIRSLAQLAVLGGALSYAFAGAWGRTRLQGQGPAAAAFGMLACSAVMSLPLAWWVEGPPELSLTPRSWAAIAYFAIAATAGAYLIYFRLLARVGSGGVMLVTLLIPPISIALGAIVLDERLSPQAYAGFALLALGLAVIDGRALAWARARTTPAP
ncbi:MAG: DMT family transporter [Paracoccaceae bacterium]